MIEGKVRLKFHKTGKLKFISHLDLQRTLKGALGRAKVPLKYTEGFNPHPKMVFALPLPVGAESVCEYLDITLVSPCDEEELKNAINAQLTRDLQIMKIYPQEHSFQEITGAEYDFLFYDLTEEDLENALSGELPIEKKSKKGFVTVDLRPKIAGYGIETKDDCVRFHALLGADSGDFVNPELLVRAIERALARPVEDYAVKRLELYTENGEAFA
ncbi:MAG: DUF2344 domain-containing protein [Clostridia bacterium]|nr:DUF2344 domain-containing protein [Clostridia bacterium]